MQKVKIQKILQQTRGFYDQVASDFSITRGKWWHVLNEFGDFATKGGRFLDLGCGNGRLAELFIDKEASYLGVDQSRELIKIAREKFIREKNIDFEVGDITQLALPLKNFEVVFMLAVLHHIPSKKLRLKILKDIYKLLKPEGRLVLSNWNILARKKYFFRFLDFKYKIFHGVWSPKDAFIPWKSIGNKNPRYVHSFTKGEIKRLLQQSGFEVEDIYYENKGVRTNFFGGYNLVVIAKKR